MFFKSPPCLRQAPSLEKPHSLDKLLQRREKADAKKAQRDFDDAWAVFAAEAEAAEAAKMEPSEFGRA